MKKKYNYEKRGNEKTAKKRKMRRIKIERDRIKEIKEKRN